MQQKTQVIKAKGRPPLKESDKLKPRFTLALSDKEYNIFLEAKDILGVKKGELARNMIKMSSSQILEKDPQTMEIITSNK